MKRLLPILIVALFATGCIPQLVGSNPLTVTVTGGQTATVAFAEDVPVTNVVMYFGGVLRVLMASHDLQCEPFESGWTCEHAGPLTGPIGVTVAADDPNGVTAQAWYSVAGGPDRIARATP